MITSSLDQTQEGSLPKLNIGLVYRQMMKVPSDESKCRTCLFTPLINVHSSLKIAFDNKTYELWIVQYSFQDGVT